MFHEQYLKTVEGKPTYTFLFYKNNAPSPENLTSTIVVNDPTHPLWEEGEMSAREYAQGASGSLPMHPEHGQMIYYSSDDPRG